MKRGIACLVASLTLVALACLDRVAFYAVAGIDPYPWIKATFGLALGFVAGLAVLCEWLENRNRRTTR